MAEAIDIRELNIRIEQQSAFVTNLVTGMDRVIVGQKHLVDSLLIGLLSDGHILLEGVPGLAKTLAIKTLSQLIDPDYSRIQFTPDLLPADVIGTMIYSQKDEKFQVKKVQYLPTSFWQMKSTVLRQRCRVPCWRPCRRNR
jgi:MoxR-like ATPase